MASSEVGSNAELNGGGAIAQGQGATAVGAGGVFVGGDLTVVYQQYKRDAVHQLGAMPEYFTGREKELNDIVNAIRSGQEGRIVSIQGLGGRGKPCSQLWRATPLTRISQMGKSFCDLGRIHPAPEKPSRCEMTF